MHQISYQPWQVRVEGAVAAALAVAVADAVDADRKAASDTAVQAWPAGLLLRGGAVPGHTVK